MHSPLWSGVQFQANCLYCLCTLGREGRFTASKREANGGVLSELIIDEVTQADFGVYNCTMMNEVGDVSLLITLTQQGKS